MARSLFFAFGAAAAAVDEEWLGPCGALVVCAPAS